MKQGDLYWIDLFEPVGSEPGFRRPHVVVQNNALNGSRIGTVITFPLTTTMNRANDRGHVVIEAGEGGLAKRSVVLTTQIGSVDRAECTEYIGRLSTARMRQIVAGIRAYIEPDEGEE